MLHTILEYLSHVMIFIIAMYFFQVVPSKIHLEATGHQLGKVLNYEDLILDIEVQEAVLKELSKHGNNTDKNILMISTDFLDYLLWGNRIAYFK